MITTILQQKEYEINEPMKKFCIYDPLDEENKTNSYLNNRVPSALVGKILIRENIYNLEKEDIVPQFENLNVNDKTKLIEVKICLALSPEILNGIYMRDMSFRDTTTRNVRLYTTSDYYIIETGKDKKQVEVGMNGYYYGNVLEFKKKNEITGKLGNLGYIFTFYFNPHIYRFSNVLVLLKDLFNID